MFVYNLKLMPQHIQAIGEALADAPYKKVAEIMALIQQQVTEQDTARMKQGEEIRPPSSPPKQPSESVEGGNNASTGNNTPKANGPVSKEINGA